MIEGIGQQNADEIAEAEALANVAIDLSICHFRHIYGQIEVFGTWFRPTGEPCLVLVPSIRRASTYLEPCIVRLTNAWIYTEEVGDGAAAALEAFEIAATLGMDPWNHRNVFAVMDAIRKDLDDLLKMPPKPISTEIVTADLIVRDHQTGAETHLEVNEDV